LVEKLVELKVEKLVDWMVDMMVDKKEFLKVALMAVSSVVLKVC
jgi:hypothetical protein